MSRTGVRRLAPARVGLGEPLFPSGRFGAENHGMESITQPCSFPPTPHCSPAMIAACLDRSSPTYTTKSWLRGPVVTVRGGDSLTVTLTSPLSRALGIHRYAYVSVRHDPAAKVVEFAFTNDETAHDGAFKLGFNGGASRKKGSPSRCFQVPAHRMPFLKRGRYRAAPSGGDRDLVVRIDLARPIN